MYKNQTVGKASYDLSIKSHDQFNAIEYEREMHRDYENYIHMACQDGKSNYPNRDFFIIVLRKRETLLGNVFRNYFFFRMSCPTPTYDQTVYKYHHKEDIIEFIWVVPDMETAAVFTRNAMLISPEERGLLQFVLDFNDGALDQLTRKLNNEE